MASSNGFLKLCNAVFPLRDFLYLLQLEEYETRQYARRASRRYLRRGFERRDTLKWTARIKVIAVLTCVLMALLIAVLIYGETPLVSAIFVAVSLILTPDVVLLANIISKPVFSIAHSRLNAQARSAREKMPNLRVIAIAGSYGKTTTKNLLNDMVRRHFKTQLIEGNINTTAGIAQWILAKLDRSTELLIVEMDAYHPGEIAKSCKIVQPNMAILTSIGNQHLVRFGSQAKIVQALQEVFAETAADGLRVCNADVAATLKEHGYNHRTQTVSIDVPIYQNEAVDLGEFSSSVREDIAYAMTIAESLNVPKRFIDEALRSFVLPGRRQQVGEVFGYEGIDDSYNISVATAEAGVIAASDLAKKAGKKLVVLTAGIPELPPKESKQKNAQYGAFIAEHADAVLVLRSEHFADVASGITKKIPMMSAKNLAEAVPILHAQCPIGDFVLLFQPELTDASY